ncbi:MAG TPA: fibrobacter succinogenes major paralogous domain-containing protein [Phnomibacter sp.]|nr:fibrobacter succinogenes major paralogous domain-containing protein [Phnomibacter sp.]
MTQTSCDSIYTRQTVKNGNWTDPSVWSDRTIPDGCTKVIIKHQILANAYVQCSEMILEGGSFQLSTGFNFLVTNFKKSVPLPSVSIGGKVWTNQNLNVGRYRNGDTIEHVQDATRWKNLTTGAWCYYAHAESNGLVFGRLYNWYAVNDPRGLAPEGWHIPTKAEWEALEAFLNDDGGKLKLTGQRPKGTGANDCPNGSGIWECPNSNATNSTGFAALPSGWRNADANFQYLYTDAHYWSATATSDKQASHVSLFSFTSAIAISNHYLKTCGFAVRLIKN